MFGINLANLVVRFTANATQFQRTLRSVEARITSMSNKFKAMGRTIALRVTAPLAGMAGVALKTFGDFDLAMTKSVSIMSGVTDTIRNEMEAVAGAISRKSITPAKELADAYFFLASAGLDAAQSMASLDTVNQFAIAGTFDMATATDLLTDAQTALGLSSKDAVENQKNMLRVSNALVGANTLANASVEQFSKSLTNKAAGAMRDLNMSLEEGVAILGVFANRGIKGELAGNALTIVLRDLQRAAFANSSVWESKGIAVFDKVTGGFRKAADIIGDLDRKFGELSARGKRGLIEALGFQDRSFSFLQALLGGQDEMREYERELNNMGDITKEVSDKQMTAFNNQMKIMANNVSAVARSIGELLAPTMLRINEMIIKWTEAWNALSESVKKSIILWSAVAAAMGPVLIIFGIFLSFVSSMVALFTNAVLLVVIFGTALSAITGTTALVIAGIATAVTSLILALKDTGALESIWNRIKSIFDSLADTFRLTQDEFQSFIDALLRGDGSFSRVMKKNFEAVIDWLKSPFGFKGVFLDLMPVMETFFKDMLLFMAEIPHLWAANFLFGTETAMRGFEKALSKPFENLSASIEKIVGNALETFPEIELPLDLGGADEFTKTMEDARAAAAGIANLSAEERAAAIASAEKQIATQKAVTQEMQRQKHIAEGGRFIGSHAFMRGTPADMISRNTSDSQDQLHGEKVQDQLLEEGRKQTMYQETIAKNTKPDVWNPTPAVAG